MNEDETGQYIMHRLKMVGWKGDPAISDDAMAAVYRFTGGVPRMINNLCSRLMLFGFLESKHSLDRPDVNQVAEDLVRDQEAILDHGPPAPPPEPEPTEILADITTLQARSRSTEEKDEVRKRTLKRALQVLSDYLESPDPDLERGQR